MGPKIEVLDDVSFAKKSPIIKEEPKKNPFAPIKKKTIKRNAKEIDLSYRNNGERRGLNVPEYVKNTPIDLLFMDLESKIMKDAFEDLTYNVLLEKFQVQTRYQLIDKLLSNLVDIQTFSKDVPEIDPNLISISLHDIKTFSRLVNLIIVHGIYAVLSKYNIGIPLEKRRLSAFAKGLKPIKIDNTEQADGKLLLLIFEKFLLIFKTENSDVKDLLLRGTGYSDFLTTSIALLTIEDIGFDSSYKTIVEQNFKQIISIPDTYELYQTYSLLLSSNKNLNSKSVKFITFISSQLQSLHYSAPRNDGLLTLIEFVCGLRDHDDINVEKFDHVANVVLSKPKTIGVVPYFTSIGNQMYDLLININKQTVNSCLCYTLEKLWAKNQLVVKDFFMKKIWTKFQANTSEVQFNNVINVLLSLVKNNPSPEFLFNVFKPILIHLWSYNLYLKKNSKSTAIINGLLVSYFTIEINNQLDVSDDIYGLDLVAQNILSDGGDDWVYSTGPNELVEIIGKSVSINSEGKEAQISNFLETLDIAIELYVNLLSEIDDEIIQKLFVRVLERWLKMGLQESTLSSSLDETNPFFALIDLRVLEGIGNKFKENLAKTPGEILNIVSTFLDYNKKLTTSSTIEVTNDSEGDSDDEDDEFEADNFAQQTLPVLLELLSAILTETMEFDEVTLISFKEIIPKLKDIKGDSEAGAQALIQRIECLINGNQARPKTLKQTQERLLKRAITSLNDPLVPIRAHGLHILRDLIVARSEVIGLDFVIQLHLVQLKDPEPFIYLNVIKGLLELINWDEHSVITTYVEIYCNKEMEIDERLRIGEVLLRYIQQSNELFSGNSAGQVVNGALQIVRRSENIKDDHDDRLRNSAMSLLGVCCSTNPIGIIDYMRDILDCTFGILKLETQPEKMVMRRAAIVLLHDLIVGTSSSKSLPFPEEYRKETWDILNYVQSTDNDLLVVEQAQTVINIIKELAESSMEEYQISDKYSALKF